MKGLEVWRNPKNLFTIVKIHYTADRDKDPMTEAGRLWKAEASAGMPRAAWNTEMEMIEQENDEAGVYALDFSDRCISPVQYNPSLDLLRGWDFGYRRAVCVYAQEEELDGKTRLNVLREESSQRKSLVEFASQMKVLTDELFHGVVGSEDYCDPAGQMTTDKSERSSIEILRQLGFRPRMRLVPYKERIDLTRRLLSECRIRLQPELCDVLINGFKGGYQYEVDSYGEPLRDEKPKKDGLYDHFQDALAYIITNKFNLRQWRSISKERLYEFNLRARLIKKPVNKFTGAWR